MSVWSLEQVNAVRGMYTRAAVDISREPTGIREGTHREAHRAIRAMAQTWAVEPDKRDVRLVNEESQPERSQVIETWSWMPDVRTVRIMGGPRDGQEWEVRDVDQPIQIKHYVGISRGLSGAAALPDEMVPVVDVMLSMVGWNEDDRVWIFGER